MTDHELLQLYISKRSQPAFAELLGRHLNMVYSVARRELRDEHQAEDVTQIVFALLLKKAADIPPQTPLAAWLHQAAYFTAISQRRDQSRRAHHEREAAMTSASAAADPIQVNPAWPAIAGEIDEAVHQLEPAQRDAVILRFFSGKTYREIAEELALTEEAARKRVDRALELLRERFVRQRFALSAAGLGTLLLTHTTQAAPAALAASLTTKLAGSSAIAIKSMLAASLLILVPVVGFIVYLAVNPRAAPVAAAPALMTSAATTTKTLAIAMPKTAHLKVRTFENSISSETSELFYRDPGQFHVKNFGDGDEASANELVWDGHQTLSTFAASRQYLLEPDIPPTDNEAMMMLYLAALTPPPQGIKEVELGIIEGQGEYPFKLVFQKDEILDNIKWRTFELQQISSTGSALMGNVKVTIAFDDHSHTRGTFESGTTRFEVLGEVNLPLDAALFDLKPPAGYFDAREGIFPFLEPAIRAVADKYYAAREAINPYRMIAVQAHFPMYRGIRDGVRWRLDNADAGRLSENRVSFRMEDPLAADITATLDRFCTLDFPVSHTIMTLGGQMAQIMMHPTDDGGPPLRANFVVPMTENNGHPPHGTSQQFKEPPRSLVGPLAGYDLRELGWPAWKGDPSSMEMSSGERKKALPEYYSLPKRSDHPKFIGIRAIDGDEITDYWIDPEHSYLCVSYTCMTVAGKPWSQDPAGWVIPSANGPRKDPNNFKITLFAKTEHGDWYPRQLSDGTVILLDTPPTITPELLDWPANVSKPTLLK